MTGHAAALHAAKDALQEGVCLYEALNRLTRETGPSVTSVLTVTALQAGAPMYGEDFAFCAKRKPNSYFFLGTRNIPQGKVGMAHNSDFDIDENALDCAAKVFCSFLRENMNGTPWNKKGRPQRHHRQLHYAIKTSPPRQNALAVTVYGRLSLVNPENSRLKGPTFPCLFTAQTR